MAITGLNIKTESYEFDVFKKENGHFEIKSGGVHIEFPAEAVEIRSLSDDRECDYGATLSVKWARGHKIHFQAYMPLKMAEKLNEHFPSLKFSEPVE